MSGSLSSRIRLTDVLDVLRSGLAALVPVVERVAIPWTEGDAYDDWENIASMLYDQIVLNTVRNTVEVSANLEFPKYDLIYPSYERIAYFDVAMADNTLGPFIGFEAIDRNFTMAKYAVRGAQGVMETTTTQRAAFAECMIRLVLPNTVDSYLEELTLRE